MTGVEWAMDRVEFKKDLIKIAKAQGLPEGSITDFAVNVFYRVASEHEQKTGKRWQPCGDEFIKLMRRDRLFPVQDGEDISWELAEKVYEGYAKEFPSSARQQSLQRICERGGWGINEVNRYLGDASPFKEEI